MTELILIRHAPSDSGGLVTGRRDVPALLPGGAALAAARRAIGPVARIVASPALRCVQTAQALWPGAAMETDPRLWEQDFGEWEGAATLPDLGPLPRDALAAFRPPGGESFADLCARVQPALALSGPGPVAIVAHAGTARAALALCTGTAALAFEIAPLSATRLRALPGGEWSVICVNQPLT